MAGESINFQLEFYGLIKGISDDDWAGKMLLPDRMARANATALQALISD
jgi:hypothetical protein